MGRDARFRQYYSVCIRSNRGHADPSVTGVFDTSLIRRRPRVSRVPVQIRPPLSSFNTTANGRPSQTSPSIRRKTVTFRTDTRFVRWYRLTHDRIRLRRVCVWGGNIFEFKPFVSALRIRIIRNRYKNRYKIKSEIRTAVEYTSRPIQGACIYGRRFRDKSGWPSGNRRFRTCSSRAICHRRKIVRSRV